MFAIARVNFALPQGAVRRSRGVAGWVLLAAGIAAVAWSLGEHLVLAQRVEAATAVVDRLRRGDAARVEKPVPAGVAAQIKAANRAIERLSTPWNALFQALEEARNERVLLLGVQPSVADGEVRLLGEADDFKAITALLDSLAAQPGLRAARLASHEIRAAGRIYFEVIAQWQR